MKIQKILVTVVVAIIVGILFCTPVHAVLVGSRTIHLYLANIKESEKSNVYLLLPIEYVKYCYTNSLGLNVEGVVTSEGEELLPENSNTTSDFTRNGIPLEAVVENADEIKAAIDKEDYIGAMKLDLSNDIKVFDFGFSGYEVSEIKDKYYTYEGNKYVQVGIPKVFYDKEYLKESYEEDTLNVEVKIDSNYEDLSFKFLVVTESGKENVIDLSKYSYTELNFGEKNYDLSVGYDVENDNTTLMVSSDIREVDPNEASETFQKDPTTTVVSSYANEEPVMVRETRELTPKMKALYISVIPLTLVVLVVVFISNGKKSEEK